MFPDATLCGNGRFEICGKWKTMSYNGAFQSNYWTTRSKSISNLWRHAKQTGVNILEAVDAGHGDEFDLDFC
jgi:hypothetical protein